MGYTSYLQALLRPLSVYDLDMGSFSGGELFALGSSFDQLNGQIQRDLAESIPLTAKEQGLQAYESALSAPMDAATVSARRQAVCALLRMQSGGCSRWELTDALTGCGVAAVVRETGTPNSVCVCFPTLSGPADNQAAMEKIIASVLPCHLSITYSFHHLQWREVIDGAWTWRVLCAGQWKELIVMGDM